MNSDNKFGTCCSCPALISDSRNLTSWKSSRTYNAELMQKLTLTNSTDFRFNLQNNAEQYIKNSFDDYNNNFKCKGSQFYLDSTNYHNEFNKLNNIPVSNDVTYLPPNTINASNINNENQKIISLSALIPIDNTTTNYYSDFKPV